MIAFRKGLGRLFFSAAVFHLALAAHSPAPARAAEDDLSRAFFDMSLREMDGEPAPDFALADLSEKTYSPKDYSGKVLLLNFMNTW